jgi:hypothetical protein
MNELFSSYRTISGNVLTFVQYGPNQKDEMPPIFKSTRVHLLEDIEDHALNLYMQGMRIRHIESAIKDSYGFDRCCLTENQDTEGKQIRSKKMQKA